jgi:adenosylcobinamide-GDP ribazoletransferase
VGAALGCILALADVGLRQLTFAPLVSSGLVVALLLGLTGGLHADGLADTCDGVFVHASPERRLAIMSDPHVGSFGVAALVVVIVLKVVAVDALPQNLRSMTLFLGPVLGRWAIVLAAAMFPTARPGGLGAQMRAAVNARSVGLATLAALAASLVLWPIGPVLAIVTCGVVWLLGRWIAGLLSGLTGDNYGALCEATELIVWLLAPPLSRVGA